MANLTQQGGLGRGLDFDLRSNRIAVVGFTTALAVLGVSSVFRDDLSLLGSVSASVAVFLGWAVGRELDPDKPGAATLTMVLSLLLALITVPGAIATGVAMLAVRATAGTVGTRIGWGDVIAIGLIGLAVGLDPNLLISGLIIATWLWAAPEVGKRRVPALVTLTTGAFGGVAWVLLGSEGYPTVQVTGMAYVLAALAGGAMMLSARPADVAVENDARIAVVSTHRVRMGRIAAGSICLWAGVWGGVAGFWAVGPIFVGLIATAIYRVFVHSA